jgi:hypothetical protein
MFNRPSFDPDRLYALEGLDALLPFVVETLPPLSAALSNGIVEPKTPLLALEWAGTPLVFITQHLSFYGVMQGSSDGQPWMAAFCSICNGGMAFSPVVNGSLHEFYVVGIYDAMVLLADKQTDSYWDHITGRCIYGALQGERLARIGDLLHLTAGVALEKYPAALLANSTIAPEYMQDAIDYDHFRQTARPDWDEGTARSLAVEDTRLPRFDMGLGVWTPTTQRFYPLTTLHTFDNVVLDVVDGRCLLVYIDPETLTPAALFVDAGGASWRGDTLQLDNGQVIRNGVLYQRGERVTVSRPLQLFERWYGFSLTFPGCDIFVSYRN